MSNLLFEVWVAELIEPHVVDILHETRITLCHLVEFLHNLLNVLLQVFEPLVLD
jgi:hypothetical protein